MQVVSYRFVLLAFNLAKFAGPLAQGLLDPLHLSFYLNSLTPYIPHGEHLGQQSEGSRGVSSPQEKSNTKTKRVIDTIPLSVIVPTAPDHTTYAYKAV